MRRPTLTLSLAWWTSSKSLKKSGETRPVTATNTISNLSSEQCSARLHTASRFDSVGTSQNNCDKDWQSSRADQSSSLVSCLQHLPLSICRLPELFHVQYSEW